MTEEENYYYYHYYYLPPRSVGWRHALHMLAASLSSMFFLGMFYRSASLYHPQRRAILHLKDMSKKKGKDKHKIERKPPYCDFSTLRVCSRQVRGRGLLL